MARPTFDLARLKQIRREHRAAVKIAASSRDAMPEYAGHVESAPIDGTLTRCGDNSIADAAPSMMLICSGIAKPIYSGATKAPDASPSMAINACA